MARRHGVTLIELVVVLFIISLLASLILVGAGVARERARWAMCASNLHQMAVAMDTFVELRKNVPAAAMPGKTGGWAVAILPFIEETSLADLLGAGMVLEADALPPAARRRPTLMSCPAAYEGDGTLQGIAPSHYVFDADREHRRRSRTHKFSWILSDVAVGSRDPWVASPEWNFSFETADDVGPHFQGMNRTGSHGDVR